MLALCVECGKNFEVESLEVTTTKEAEKHSFFCPRCGQEYIAFFKDASVKEKQAKIKKLYERMRKPGITQKQQKKLMMIIEKAENAVKKEMDALRKKYAKE